MSKRVVDVIVAAGALVVLSPLLAAVAVAVQLESPGGALFRQLRVGKNGKTFQILKFRSMRVDTNGPEVTSARDSRITRVGRLIRSTKLDELPQLVNVLRGEMSLVGPRPEVAKYVAHWPPEDREVILSVRPGITDPASVAFRREAEILATQEDPERFYIERILPEKVALYRQYVQKRSTIGDLKVLAETVRRTLGG
ncbi:sugar transferase [Cumulibacter manganitolerans]|uniref:sugar transferase n=1 Tax=Cumulibacter manganitolerans TaxID=1884992 RepID=UPI001296C171|nr:sugar transferase [Cumulibacter manganitolerans]